MRNTSHSFNVVELSPILVRPNCMRNIALLQCCGTFPLLGSSQLHAEQMLGFVNETMNVRMDIHDIVACHELPARNNDTVKPVIVCLLNSAVKRDLMMARKNLKGSRIYVNEQLTKKNAGLFKKARELRRNGVIDGTWTYNGRVFVKKTPTATPVEIRDEDDLQSFSRK